MQADVLVELVRHATAGNQPAIRQSVERLIAEEEQTGHRILAERLQKALQAPHTLSRERPHRLSSSKAALRRRKRSITRLSPHADREFGEITAFMMMQLKTVSKKHYN